MTSEDFDLLAPHLSSVALGKGFVIAQPSEPIEHVYFMESGVGSSVAVSPEGQEVEAGLFGRDSVAPTDLIMGSDRTLNRIFIQVADDAWRIGQEAFMAAVNASLSLRNLLTRYVQTLAIQTTYTALSNAVHPIDERLARWILMCDDRSDDSRFALTHEFMSIMLAVRRPSVTTSLHVLEGNGFITSERGCITVRNRQALEAFAGDAYGKPEAEYRRLIGDMRGRLPPRYEPEQRQSDMLTD